MEAQLPTLAYHFGLTPADVWAMTVSQYAEFLTALDTLKREMEKT